MKQREKKIHVLYPQEILKHQKIKTAEFAKHVDPYNEPPHLDLRCLSYIAKNSCSISGLSARIPIQGL